MSHKFRRLSAVAAGLLYCSVSTNALAADQAIVVSDVSFVSYANGLRDSLIAAGYEVTVTTDINTVLADLSSAKQVWDMSISGAMSNTASTNYLSYLQGGGGLFLLGENAGFAARNNSLVSFIVDAGGGTVTYGGATVSTQYVTDIFNGSALIVADSATAISVPAAGTFATFGTGTFITTTLPNGAGAGTGIAFGAGSLSNALTGRLLTYLDINTFSGPAPGSPLNLLVNRMINFVAGSFQVDPDLPPVGGAPAAIDDSKPSFDLSDDAASGSTISFDGGTLDVTGGSDPDNLITADVSVSENGAFINTAGGSSTFSGEITGDGGLFLSGQGTIALTGSNSYAGGTLITDSTTVQIASGDALGSGDVVLTDGQLAVLQDATIGSDFTLMSGLNAINTGDNDVTIDGEISGAGGFVKAGTGTLILTGDNTYTGDTVIAAGTLQGNAASIGGNVVNGGALVFNQTTNGSFEGDISGPGSLAKTGAGTLILTGNSGYNGATVVDAGRLTVNGSIANSIVTLQSGASIGGNGTLGGLIVRTAATAAPGNSIGQLQVATTVLFEAGSIYEVEVDATGASDRIAASGVATLEGGTVQVLAETGNYQPRTSYQILSAAGGVNGRFEGVTSNLAFLTPTLAYGGNAVTLTLTRNDLRFAGVAETANQRATANAIDASFASTSSVYDALVGQSAASARRAFDSLSGEVHASALSVAAQQTDEMRRALLDRLDAPGGERLTLWTEMAGGWNTLDGDRNSARVSSDARGFRVGLEGTTGAFRFGAAGGYTEGDLAISARASQADIEAISGAVYAGGAFGSLSVRAGASYTDFDFKTSRTAAVGALSQNLEASYSGRVIQSFAEAGSSFPLGIGSVEPFAGVNAVWLKNDAFAERGGSLALRGQEESRKQAWSTLGVKASFPLGAGSPASARIKAGWQHALTDQPIDSALAFAAGGPGFTVEGAPLLKDAALVDAGINWAASSGITLGVAYSGSIANQGQSHAAKVALGVRF